MPSKVVVGIVLTVISAFAFGSGALFAKPVYAAGVGWHELMAWRFLIGAAAAWAWIALYPRARASVRRLDRRALAVSIALGVLYTGNSATYYAGLEEVSASLAGLMVYTYPVIVAVISLQVGRPLEGRRAWTALAIALAGVALAVGNIDQAAPPPLLSLALVAVSPVIYSAWIVLSARLSGERRSGAGMGSEHAEAADPTAAGAVMLTTTTATYWVTALALNRPVLPGQIPGEAWFGIVGVGLVATFVAVQAFYAGAHRIGAARASLVSTVEPVWTIVLASQLFAESLTPLQFVGGALILIGVVIAQTGGGARRAATELRLADE